MTDHAAYFRLRASGYELAAQVVEQLASMDGADAALIRDCEPQVSVAESDRSGSTYVYLDGVKSRVSDHAGGAAGEINERLDAAQMVVRWLAETRAEIEV